MNARVASIVCALVCALLFVTGSAASVFSADELIPTFKRLKERGCLPTNFNSSATKKAAKGCAAAVKGGNLPPECDQAPVLAQFYNCYGSSRGLLNADATLFDVSEMKKNLDDYTNDQDWLKDARNMITNCEDDMEDSRLTGSHRPLNVYSFLCFKWRLFSDCDQQLGNNGLLDEEGKLRQVRFLKGDCLLSPNSLEDALEEITDPTLAECGSDLYAGDNATQLHDGQVSRIVCLLKNFIDDSNHMQFDDLEDAIGDPGSAIDESADLLLDILDKCDSNEDPVAFVRCWASYGVSHCASEEANKVAGQFPDDCAISVDLD